jgi:multiple sugar transport system substrate-binding protein
VLNGITWGHSRGITPLLAASQRYTELHPGIEIRWKKRTLQEFADFPIEKLTTEYDLLIIDHPWVGCADATRCVLDLNNYLSKEYLADQLANSVGGSHESYQFNNGQWALAIDAAAPAASYRHDLLQQNNTPVPQTWENVIDLAKAGKVAVAGIPIDMLMNFYMACIAMGEAPFQNEREVVGKDAGTEAIELLRQLYSLVDTKMFAANPIAVAEWMSNRDQYWYCPFAYCYSNYSRQGYSNHLLTYGDLVTYRHQRLRTTIGGTGLAVSAFSKHNEVALDFAAMVVSGECQRTLYVQNGGQPGHRSAWIDDNANRLTNNFFNQVLPVMENGYIRPRYNGYLHFQDHAGTPLQECIINKGNAAKALEEMNSIYRHSISKKQVTTGL